MTRIDFMRLSAGGEAARLHFTCRLAQRALREGHQVFIACRDQAQQQQLDQLLWSFEPESFVAHQPLGSQTPAPIALCHGDSCGDHQDLLINLQAGVPDFFSRFHRLIEIVSQDDAVLTQSRDHWRYYKSRGYPIDSKSV